MYQRQQSTTKSSLADICCNKNNVLVNDQELGACIGKPLIEGPQVSGGFRASPPSLMLGAARVLKNPSLVLIKASPSKQRSLSSLSNPPNLPF